MIITSDNLSQPADLTRESSFAREVDVRWLSTPSAGLSNHRILRNVISSIAAPSQDANNELEAGVTRHGVAGVPTGANLSAINYLTDSSVIFKDATELTIGVAFVFDSADDSVQWMNFRYDLKMTLDIFSKTTSSINWGSDWFGAWNGSSQQTLSGLNTGDLVCLCSVIRQNGARLFHQGRFSGTKSGSSGSVGTSQIKIAHRTRSKLLVSFAAASAASDEWATAFTANPWLVFDDVDSGRDAARIFYFSGGAGGGSALPLFRNHYTNQGIA